MNIRVHGISPLLAVLLILALVVPMGVVVTPAAPARADAQSVTVTMPTTAQPAFSSRGQQIAVTFQATLTGNTTGTLDGYIYLINQSSLTVASSYFSVPNVDPTANAGIYTSSPFNLTVPLTADNGTYNLSVAVRQNGLPANFVTSTVQNNAVFISTAAPGGIVAPVLSQPVTGSCQGATPTLSWSEATADQYYTYHLQVASDNFTTVVQDWPGLTTAAKTVSALSAGTYYWRVQAIDRYGNVSGWSSVWSIVVDLASSFAAPTNTSPTDGFSQPASYNPTYAWSAGAATPPGSSVLSYTVETYSGTNPGTGTTPAQGATLVDTATVTSATYTRNQLFTSSAGGTQYWWRVKEFNCAGVTSGYSTPTSFTMGAVNNSVTINLYQGWNLISLPLIPTNTAITSVLPANVRSNIASVYTLVYNTTYSSAPTWATWTPTLSGTLTTMRDGPSYWIYANAPVSFAVTGTPCPTFTTSTQAPTIVSYAVYYSSAYPDGWNMIGFKSTVQEKVQDYLANLNNGTSNIYTGVYQWSGGWRQLAGTDYLQPGVGYYIRMTASGSILPPCQ